MWLLAAALLLQAKETVPSEERSIYWAAYNDCRKAEKLIDAEPAAAVDRCSRIISDAKIRKRECLMRIEELKGVYTEWYEFFPLQYRARARAKIAESEKPADALKSLEAARTDLLESIKLGVEASRGHLRDVESRIVRVTVRDLVDRGQYRSAHDYVSGSKLDAEERAREAADVERRCADAVARQLADYWQGLPAPLTAKRLAAVTAEEFDRRFRLPAGDPLVGELADLAWMRAFHAALAALHKEPSQAAAGAMLDAALAAEPGSERFSAAARLAHDAFMERWAGGRELDEAGVKRLRQEVEAALVRWNAFADAVKARRPPGKTEEMLAELAGQLARVGFAYADPSQVDELQKALDGAFTSEAPDHALTRVWMSLTLLLESELPRESRRRALSLAVAAGAMSHLLQGRTTEQAVAALSGEAKKLRDAGGPVEPGRYGPRVADVFERLSK